MQFTGEVHWRQVFEIDGTLRSYDMDRKEVGTRRIRTSYATDLGNDGDNNCFEVWLKGNRVIMRRDPDGKFPNAGASGEEREKREKP